MKKLSDLMKTDVLTVKELFDIKGGADEKAAGCTSWNCKHSACKSGACNSNTCSSQACISGACKTKATLAVAGL